MAGCRGGWWYQGVLGVFYSVLVLGFPSTRAAGKPVAQCLNHGLVFGDSHSSGTCWLNILALRLHFFECTCLQWSFNLGCSLSSSLVREVKCRQWITSDGAGCVLPSWTCVSDLAAVLWGWRAGGAHSEVMCSTGGLPGAGAALGSRAVARGFYFKVLAFPNHKRTCLKFIPSRWSWESSITLRSGCLFAHRALTRPSIASCVGREGGSGAEVALQEHSGQLWHSPGTASSSSACVAASQLRHWLGWHRCLHN